MHVGDLGRAVYLAGLATGCKRLAPEASCFEGVPFPYLSASTCALRLVHLQRYCLTANNAGAGT